MGQGNWSELMGRNGAKSRAIVRENLFEAAKDLRKRNLTDLELFAICLSLDLERQ